MNIDADFLATRYRNQGRFKSTPGVDHQPSQTVSFTINGLRINSQFDSSIHFHINGYHLRQYAQQQNNWSDDAWNSIDFDAFGKFFRRLKPSQQVRQTKLIHGQLPIGTRRHQQARIKDEALKLCPCCKIEEESASHFLRCSKNPAHESSIRQLDQYLQKGDHHPVKYLIKGAIRKWTLQTEPNYTNNSEYPRRLRQLITTAMESQKRIGWEQLLKGYIRKHWRTLASKEMYTEATHNERQGDFMVRSILLGVSDHFSRLWEARSKVLHDTSDKELCDVRSTEMAEVKYYFSRPELLRFDDRHYCEGSLTALVNGRSSHRRRWLRRVKKSIELKASQGGRQSLITSFVTSRRRDA